MSLSRSELAWLLTDVLREVSRAFYLSLRVLPRAMREPLGLAYLAARAADTVADTAALPPEARLDFLRRLQWQFQHGSDPRDQAALAAQVADRQADPGERRLLLSLDLVLHALHALPEPDRRSAQQVLATLTEGMEQDLLRFPPEGCGQVSALETADDLDRYTYLVAGCVGPFWTRVTARHCAPLRHWDVEAMSELGVRFGKALQLTNVLRDVARDVRSGRCYLPREELARYRVQPEDLLHPRNDLRVRPVLLNWLRVALDHYRAAEEYVLAIPPRCTRLRLAVLWPVLIGLATVARVARSHCWLSPGSRIRVPRAWVYRTLLVSWLLSGSDRALRRWFEGLQRDAESALHWDSQGGERTR
ncbi:MAG: squalene/phytoene synthase family protein [Candidatus Eremiobacterota bacterium]